MELQAKKAKEVNYPSHVLAQLQREPWLVFEWQAEPELTKDGQPKMASGDSTALLD